MEIVAVADLKIGMFVVEPDCPWSDLPFPLQGFAISTPRQIDVFREKCRYVYVDRSRSLEDWYVEKKREFDRPLQSRPLTGSGPEAPAPRALGKPAMLWQETLQPAPLKQRRRSFLTMLQNSEDRFDRYALSQELVRIEPQFDQLAQSLEKTLKAVEQEAPVDAHEVQDGVREIAGSLKRNPDALQWLLRLKRADEYSFDHAMDVSINMMMLGVHIGWRGQRLFNLGLAGMLQDVGKNALPPGVLSKREPLSPDEKRLVRSHVAGSLEILYEMSGLPEDVLMIVARHHERWDGSGYPRGLQSVNIGLAAEMAGLVDSFCAMLKDKPYRAAIGHQQALEELHKQRDSLFNPVLMEQFVQCVGLYPVGSLVELNTGEVGVVLQQNRVQRSRPSLLIMLDAKKEPVTSYTVIDLRDDANASYRVAQALPLGAYGLSAHDYYLG